MKKLTGSTVILVALFLSANVFAEGFAFEFNGKKYEAAKQDLYGYYDWPGAQAACEGFVDPDDLNDDWLLPPKEELNAMYEQLHKKGVGGFANDSYWSSSEDGDSYAWCQAFFGNGTTSNYGKGHYRSRCVRLYNNLNIFIR